MAMMCVDCGSEVAGLVGGSCPACFAAKHVLLQVPSTLVVELCAHCDARRVGNRWAEAEPGAPLEWLREDAVREAVQVHTRVREPLLDLECEVQDERNHLYRIHLEGLVEGTEVTADGETVVRNRRGVCDRCSSIQGGYYAAIIQLRATDRDVLPGELDRAHTIIGNELDRMQASGNRFAFLSKSGPMHGGFDYYVGDIEAARQACRVLNSELGASVQESAKLVGRREGEDVYRVTFLVRIHLFAPGDFAVLDDGTSLGERVVQVHSVDRGHAVCVDLGTHKRTKVTVKHLQRLGGRDVVQEAILVSQDASDLQVMDPENYTTKDLPRPEGFAASGEMVEVVRFGGRMWLVP